MKLCNFFGQQLSAFSFVVRFSATLPLLAPYTSLPLADYANVLAAGSWIGLPGTPTLTLIAIVCGISTCLYRSQRPRLLPPVSLSPCLSPSLPCLNTLLLPACSCALSLPYPRCIPALSMPGQKLFFQHGSTSTTSFAFLALCLWQRHNQRGQAAAPLQAQLFRYWQAITTETPLPRGESPLDARLFILDSQLLPALSLVFLFVAAAAAARCRPF